MSASLVGSEMCIRDSSRHGSRRSGAELRMRGPRKARTQLQARWGCLAPVSYTHLTLPTICSV
eukprot:1492290-Alexandrium_andersonii.AAC.1